MSAWGSVGEIYNAALGTLPSQLGPDRQNRLDQKFQSTKNDKDALKRMFEKFPKGAMLHEHLGAPFIMLLDCAIEKGLFVDPASGSVSAEQHEGYIPAANLKLHDETSLKTRALFYQKVTQPKINTFGQTSNKVLSANTHFFATFVPTGLIDVPLGERLAEEWISASRQNISATLVMIDFPNQEDPPILELPSTIEELTDDVLESFLSNIQGWLDEETDFWIEKLKGAEKDAEACLLKKVPEYDAWERPAFFGPDNPINISIQAEVGKSHALACRDSSKSRLVAAFAAEAAKAMEMVKRFEPVKSINCVGPEFLIDQDLELIQARILDFLYRKYKCRIAFHAGELTIETASNMRMCNIVATVVNECHGIRVGHGTCLSHDPNLKLLGGIPIEVGITAAKRLLDAAHPYYEFYKEGIPLVAITDNQHVFNTTLSKEFYLIFKRWPGCTYADVVTLARNSLYYSDLVGDDILVRCEDGHFKIKEEFRLLVEGKFELKGHESFESLSEKQRVEVRYERALRKFEENFLN